MQQGGGIAAAERGEADGFGGGIRGLAGRWPDADVLLQGGMSEGLRDWDLWGPLIFCLLLSLFLSRGAKSDQRDLVFSGIFAMVWIGEAVVTLQIKLLGGNMYVDRTSFQRLHANTRRVPSSSPSPSSATRCSRSSSPRCSVQWACPCWSGSPSILFSSRGRWRQASASWAARAWSGTVLESQYTLCLSSTLRWAASASSVDLVAVKHAVRQRALGVPYQAFRLRSTSQRDTGISSRDNKRYTALSRIQAKTYHASKPRPTVIQNQCAPPRLIIAE